MALRSFTAEELEKARTARKMVLISKWTKRGRLSRPEIEEIREVIGEEEYAKAIRELEQTPSVAFDPGTSRGEYHHELAHYAAIYKRSTRQIKRWTKAGRTASTPELPPLDDPGRMLDWWHRMEEAGQLKQKAPAILEQFAVDVAKGAPAKGMLSDLPSIDISKLEFEQGIEVQQAYRFLAAVGQQLEKAYAIGQDALISKVQKRWESALSAARLAEESQRKAQKASGDLLPKPEVVSELLVLIETISNMQRTMARRIRARFAGWLLDQLFELRRLLEAYGIPSDELNNVLAWIDRLPAAFDARLDQVIEIERSREVAALRQAKVLRDQGEVILELDQAAGV